MDTTANALDALSVRSRPHVHQSWVFGKVAAVSGNDISVTLRNGLTLSVVVSATTTYTNDGAAATLADVTVGIFVRAAGTVDTTANALDATSVSIVAAARTARCPDGRAPSSVARATLSARVSRAAASAGHDDPPPGPLAVDPSRQALPAGGARAPFGARAPKCNETFGAGAHAVNPGPC